MRSQATTREITGAAALSLAVIGHVNHGKSALVRALTGVETDRLPEEKARGMSITLGFAWRGYPDGSVDFLDSPGHEDFIRAMVMGATGARAVLLVVSATEGFGRQTHEHLRIASLLGLRAGVVAVTKADLLTEDARAATRATILGELDGTFLAGEPVVFCSSITGAGLDTLHDALQALALRAPPAPRLPGAYLPLDRIFTVPGAGTVVTGTLQGATLAAGDQVIMQPSGRKASLRQLQVHGQATETARPGGRLAVGLRAVSAEEIKVGEALCAPGLYEAGLRVDVLLELTSESARPLRPTEEVRVMWGARQDIAKVQLIGTAAAVRGGPVLAQLRFARPVVAYAGQRAILRRPSPAETIGGAVVLDPVAPALRGRTMAARRALLEAAAGGGLDEIAAELGKAAGGAFGVAEAARLSRRPAAEIRALISQSFEALDDDLMASKAAITQARQSFLDQLAASHREQPARAWVPLGGVRGRLSRSYCRELITHVEKALAAAGEIRLHDGQAALRDHDPLAALSPAALARLRQIEASFRAGGMTPPQAPGPDAPQPDDPALIGLLLASGRLVSLRNVALRQTLTFHAQALEDAAEALRAAFPDAQAFTTGQARAVLSTSRKFIVPVMELFDARGESVRDGDVRQMLEKGFGVPPKPL